MSSGVTSERPNLYTIDLAKAHGLEDGDWVRLITKDNRSVRVPVHVVNNKSFSVEAAEKLGDQVFVYGKECKDLEAVDYDAISMLNVSATQELAKKVETLEKENSDLRNQAGRLTSLEEQQKAAICKQGQQVADLETTNSSMKARVAELEAENKRIVAMAVDMEALKKTLTIIQEKENGGARTVAFQQ
jgi:hypothetical protein